MYASTITTAARYILYEFGGEFGGRGIKVYTNTLEKASSAKNCKEVRDSLTTLNSSLGSSISVSAFGNPEDVEYYIAYEMFADNSSNDICYVYTYFSYTGNTKMTFRKFYASASRNVLSSYRVYSRGGSTTSLVDQT